MIKNVNNRNWVCDLRLKMILKLNRKVLLTKFEVIVWTVPTYASIFTYYDAIKKIK